MSFLGQLFGSPKAIGAAARAARDGIDALVYTDQEKAADQAKDAADARAVLIRWMDASKGQNLARRIIGVGVFMIWSILWMGAAMTRIIGIWVSDADRWSETSTALAGYAGEINTEFIIVLGFYFAAPHLARFLPERKT